MDSIFCVCLFALYALLHFFYLVAYNFLNGLLQVMEAMRKWNDLDLNHLLLGNSSKTKQVTYWHDYKQRKFRRDSSLIFKYRSLSLSLSINIYLWMNIFRYLKSLKPCRFLQLCHCVKMNFRNDERFFWVLLNIEYKNLFLNLIINVLIMIY